MLEERCIRCGNRVPWVSFWGNVVVTIFKLTVAFLGGSAALVADGCHTLTDVIGTGFIIITRKVSNRPSDEKHPYGYGKAEFIGSIFIYTVLSFVSIIIFGSGLLAIVENRLSKPQLVTLLGAAVSVLYNWMVYLYGRCAGRKNNSPAVLANAFENRADAISSVAVIAGIAAAIFVHPICDPLAAMIVGTIIFWNCMTRLRESLTGLMDRGLAPEIVHRIKRVALAQPGVAGVDFIKTRQTGTKYWLDLGILVPGELPVTQSDAIAAEVHNELMRRSERFQKVEVFVSPAPEQSRRRRLFLFPKRAEKGRGEGR